jgi:hypothetical protein
MRARDNPLRTDRVLQVRYRLQGATWNELLTRCQQLHYRGAVIGPHGSGKTTLLEDLEPQLRRRGFETHFLRLSEEVRTFPPGQVGKLFRRLTGHDLLLLDGAEQMNPLRWCWFRWRARRAGGLLITTHGPGRLPTLWECRTSPALLAGIAAELLEAQGEAERDAVLAHAETFFAKHGGNLRHALRDWYDLLAQ